MDQFEDVLKINAFEPELASRMSLTYRNSLLYQRLMDQSLEEAHVAGIQAQIPHEAISAS